MRLLIFCINKGALNSDTLIVEADKKSDRIETLDLQDQAKALKPLDGSLVCISWAEESQIETLDEYLSTANMAQRRVGRPQKVTALSIVVGQLFPDGVGDTPLK